MPVTDTGKTEEMGQASHHAGLGSVGANLGGGLAGCHLDVVAGALHAQGVAQVLAFEQSVEAVSLLERSVLRTPIC